MTSIGLLHDGNGLLSLEEGLNVLDQKEVNKFASELHLSVGRMTKLPVIDMIVRFIKKTVSVDKRGTLEDKKLNEIRRKLVNKNCFKININTCKVFFKVCASQSIDFFNVPNFLISTAPYQSF